MTEKRSAPPRDDRRRPGASGAAQLGFLLLLLGYALALLATLGELSPDARLFPLIVLAGLGLLWALKLVATLAPARLGSFLEPAGLMPPQASRQAAPTDSSDPPAAPSGATPSAWAVWAWLGGTLLLMALLGFLAGTAVSVLIYLRALARESWRVALIAAAVTSLFVHLVFAWGLRLDLSSGLLALPWPT